MPLSAHAPRFFGRFRGPARVRLHPWWAVLVGVLGLWPIGASAQTEGLQYQAPEGCPKAKEFAAEVTRRREVEPRENEPRSFHIQLMESGDAYAGVLRVRAYGAETSMRSVQAPTCEEVAIALALVTALTWDGAPPAPPEPPRPARKVKVRRERADAPNAFSETEPETRGWWGVGFHLDALAGALPEIRPSPRLFVDARLERSGIWAPSVRLSAARARSQTHAAALIWTAGRLDVCPTNVPVSESAMFWPCATFEAGSILTQDAVGIANEALGPRLWLSVGSVMRIQWILWGVVLLDVEAGLALPLHRPDLETASKTMVHQISAVSGHLGAGIGARFP